jgi:hypothetical protein
MEPEMAPHREAPIEHREADFQVRRIIGYPEVTLSLVAHAKSKTPESGVIPPIGNRAKSRGLFLNPSYCVMPSSFSWYSTIFLIWS